MIQVAFEAGKIVYRTIRRAEVIRDYRFVSIIRYIVVGDKLYPNLVIIREYHYLRYVCIS